MQLKEARSKALEQATGLPELQWLKSKWVECDMTNTFAPDITPTEKAILSEAIADTRPGWQFVRKGKHLTAYREVWGHVQVGGKSPGPFKALSARTLADRIRAYEEARRLVRERPVQMVVLDDA